MDSNIKRKNDFLVLHKYAGKLLHNVNIQKHSCCYSCNRDNYMKALYFILKNNCYNFETQECDTKKLFEVGRKYFVNDYKPVSDFNNSIQQL